MVLLLANVVTLCFLLVAVTQDDEGSRLHAPRHAAPPGTVVHPDARRNGSSSAASPRPRGLSAPPQSTGAVTVVHPPGGGSGPLHELLQCASHALRSKGLRGSTVQRLQHGELSERGVGPEESGAEDPLVSGMFVESSDSMANLWRGAKRGVLSPQGFVAVLRAPTQRLWALYHMHAQHRGRAALVEEAGFEAGSVGHCVRFMSLETAMQAPQPAPRDRAPRFARSPRPERERVLREVTRAPARRRSTAPPSTRRRPPPASPARASHARRKDDARPHAHPHAHAHPHM